MAQSKAPCLLCGCKASRKSTFTQKVQIIERNGKPVKEVAKVTIPIRKCTKCKSIVHMGKE